LGVEYRGEEARMNTLELENKVTALILEGKNDEAFLMDYDENVFPRRLVIATA
jgi:hypothetical protein